MRTWKELWHTVTSFLICASVVIIATLLYPLILLFFAFIAIGHLLYRKRVAPSTGEDAGLSGGGAEG